MRNCKNIFVFGILILGIAIQFISCIKDNPTPPPTVPPNVIINSNDLVLDKTGNIYLTNGNCNILKVNTSGTVISFAGTEKSGCSGDGGPATSATINFPIGICIDSVGNIYFSDSFCQAIHKINISTGIMTRIAGLCNGYPGYNGDGGAANSAELDSPGGISFDNSGNLYIADANNNRIRKVNFKTGIITTIAGNGPSGERGHYGGDGGPATSAQLNYPGSIALDDSLNVYIADCGNYRIRKVNAITGIINTIAGNGQSIFNGDSIPALSAAIYVEYIVIDTSKNIYLTDYNNRIRKINGKTGIITTIAGNGIAGYSGDGGPATAAEISDPTGIALDNSGNVYFIDVGNSRVRKITVTTGIITTVAHN
ncbi:MAG: hypothetical protein ACLQQ4_07635 [Bacteroidia bacterium]